jgi:S-adenosylmethionine synthetase
LTPTERLVLGIERYINGDMRAKDGIKAAGRDVKVMAHRVGDKITLTVACAMIASRVASASEYRSILDAVVTLLNDEAFHHLEGGAEIAVNHADVRDSDDPADHYITVTGLSMENGDDGSVGRGNRVNGLITPYRPMSMEAAAGKNPVTHVGKLYNILAHRIAGRISDEAGEELGEVRVRLLSQIGSPIDRPILASVELGVPDERTFRRWKRTATELTDIELQNIEGLTQQIVYGEVGVF